MTTFEERAPPVRRVLPPISWIAQLISKYLGTIALEEAIQLPEFRSKTIQYGNPNSMVAGNNPAAYNPDKWEDLADLIVDIHDKRLKTMDKGTDPRFIAKANSASGLRISDFVVDFPWCTRILR